MTRLDKAGRVVVPAECRRALGVKPGDRLIVLLDEEEIRLFTPLHAVRRARALVRRFVPKGRRLSQELIERRRGGPSDG